MYVKKYFCSRGILYVCIVIVFMEKDFVPHEEALQLKALGFDEPCFGTWIRKVTGEYSFSLAGSRNSKDWEGSRHCSAPTFSQAFRFFRENYGLDSFRRQTERSGMSYWKINIMESEEKVRGYSKFEYTYEEAELECLRKLIQLV